MIRNYGDLLWEEICNKFRGPFTVADAADLPCLAGLAHRTRVDIVRSILANVEAEHAERPEDCPFVRRGRGHYVWR